MKAFTFLPIALLTTLSAAAPSSAEAPAGLDDITLLVTRNGAASTTCTAERQALVTCSEKAENELSTCEAQVAAGSPYEDYAKCPSIDKTTITISGVTYTQYCNQGIVTGIPTLRRENIRYAACLEACSADTNCQGFNYWPGHAQPCLMFSQYTTRLGGKKSTDILIGAVPTKQK